MAFKFTLQAVLEQRLANEERLQRDYSQTLARIADLKRGVQELERDRARWIDQARERQATLAPERRALYEDWIASRGIEIEGIERQIARMNQIAEQERRRLIRAMQERTMMERLRDREQEEFRREHERAEQRRFDEFGVRGFLEQRQKSDEAQAEKSASPRERNS